MGDKERKREWEKERGRKQERMLEISTYYIHNIDHKARCSAGYPASERENETKRDKKRGRERERGRKKKGS